MTSPNYAKCEKFLCKFLPLNLEKFCLGFYGDVMQKALLVFIQPHSTFLVKPLQPFPYVLENLTSEPHHQASSAKTFRRRPTVSECDSFRRASKFSSSEQVSLNPSALWGEHISGYLCKRRIKDDINAVFQKYVQHNMASLEQTCWPNSASRSHFPQASPQGFLLVLRLHKHIWKSTQREVS